MLLSVRNTRQRQESDCLGACVAMVLEYLGIRVDYYRLLRLLSTGGPGTPFFNIARVSSLGVFVKTGQYQDDFLLFEHNISLGLPIVTAVETGPLEHWGGIETAHTVVVVGFNHESVFINDPFFSDTLIEIPTLRFLNAWSDRDYQYAIIGLIDPDL